MAFNLIALVVFIAGLAFWIAGWRCLRLVERKLDELKPK